MENISWTQKTIKWMYSKSGHTEFLSKGLKIDGIEEKYDFGLSDVVREYEILKEIKKNLTPALRIPSEYSELAKKIGNLSYSQSKIFNFFSQKFFKNLAVFF